MAAQAEKSPKDSNPPRPAKPETAEKGAGKGDKKKKGKAGPELDKKGRPKKRKKGRGFFILLAVLIIIILCAGAYVVIRFNISDMRTKLLQFVNLLDPQYVDLLDEQEKVHEDREALNALERELKELEQTLNKKQIDIQQRETELEAAQENRIPIYRLDPVPEQLLTDIKNLSKTYASMDAADAARILATLYSIEDMAAIIYYMNASAAASILTEMDIRLAAQITEELLKE